MNLKRIAPLGLLALAACVSQPKPTPTPAPRPTPVVRPTPPAPPPPATWMDAPRTPGNWSYEQGQANYLAPSGGTLFSMACERGAGQITLSRPGSAPARSSMRILTETTARTLNASQSASALTSAVPARDPILDAMAFSKGRFAVESPGLPTLFLPSWIEVSRVIEDCR